jgi:hypothetical protein
MRTVKKISDKFENDIVHGLPFGIDICLDYEMASVQKDEFRMAQLDQRQFKIDFLIAAGKGLDISNYTNTPYIQYAVHNEGSSGNAGYTTAWKLNHSTKPVSKKDLEPLDAKAKDKGVIAIDQTDTFKAPKDADMTDIPNITDKMNTGIVRIWQLDMDTDIAATLVAQKQTQTPKVREIHFIE